MREIFRIRIAKYQYIDIVMISRRYMRYAQFEQLGYIFENVVASFFRNDIHKNKQARNMHKST